MINDFDDAIKSIKSNFPDLRIRMDKYGSLYAIALFNEVESYQIDITENEVGVTYRTPSEIDFSGCDISFKDIGKAVEFLVNYRLKIKVNADKF